MHIFFSAFSAMRKRKNRKPESVGGKKSENSVKSLLAGMNRSSHATRIDIYYYNSNNNRIYICQCV